MDLTKTKLYRVSNKKYLAELLNIEYKELMNIDLHFQPTIFSKKVNNKNRILCNPQPKHKKALRRITKLLYPIGIPHYIFGGVPNKNYISNAKRHLNKDFVLLTDIKNFFPSTRDSYVYDFFKNKLQTSTDIAKILTLLTTYQMNPDDDYRSLPQGYPSSPLLSFLSYYEMFNELNTLSKTNNYYFSSYYDDLTFSSKTYIDNKFQYQVLEIVKRYNFYLHSKKTENRSINNSVITGVYIKNKIPKATRKLHNKMHKNYVILKHMDNNHALFTKEQFKNQCNKTQGCVTSIKSIEKNNNLNYVLNYIREMRELNG